MFMIFVFIFEMLLFSLFGSLSVEPMECILYVICLWICGYYCWKFLNEEKKYHKLAYVFLSNVMFSFVIICKCLDLYISNL
jgi:hypothetical protein